MSNNELAQLLTDALNELGEISIALKHSVACHAAIVKILAVRAELVKSEMVPTQENKQT